MRDKHYKVKQFRLSEEVYKKLSDLKNKKGKTWNLLFYELLQRVPKK
jgi:predicted DNA-binding protein